MSCTHLFQKSSSCSAPDLIHLPNRTYRVGHSVLEKALVVPEDRSYAQCVQQLPRPGGGLIPDPILAAKRKAGKGAKGSQVCMCIIYIYVSIYIHIRVFMYTYVHSHMYTYIYDMYMCVCMYLYLWKYPTHPCMLLCNLGVANSGRLDQMPGVLCNKIFIFAQRSLFLWELFEKETWFSIKPTNQIHHI